MTRLEIGKLQRIELVDEGPRPVVQDLDDRNLVGDAEGEIKVRESVAAVERERAHDRSGDDACILTRELFCALTEGIPLLDGEREAEDTRTLNPSRRLS